MKTFLKKPILFTTLIFEILPGWTHVNSDTTLVYMKDFGLVNTGRHDCMPFIKNAVESVAGENQKKLIFEKGTYHFYPEESVKRDYFESNTTDKNPRNCAFVFENIKNLVVDAKGSTFIFHEQMQPFSFDECENIVLKNVTIDWDKPLIAQAEVLQTTDEFIKIAIDRNQFPYKIANGKLVFKQGKNEWNAWVRAMEYDRAGRFVVPQTGDQACLGRGWQDYSAQEIIPGVVQLNHRFLRLPALGNILVLRHAERIHSGIFIQNSKNITIKKTDIFHATGLGILAQFSQDLTFDTYRAIPKPNSNRYFGGGDDGLQVSNCKGQITILNCEFAGLQDDPVNVHGTSVQIQKIISDKKLECKFMHEQSTGMMWGNKSDLVRFIENEQMVSLGIGEIANIERVDNQYFVVTFKNAVPEFVEINDALENLTWTPDLHVRDSHFKSCRARGILISTPGKVILENNIFESSGSAILISGDANGWFESGAVSDVLIKNNEFTDLCNTSSYQFCEGIISIFPVIPGFDNSTPAFHKNIRIQNNRFHCFDYPVIYAKSVNGISFTNNVLTRSYRFQPYHRRRFTFSFEGCTNVLIEKNIFSPDLLGKNILLKSTGMQELTIDSEFQIEFIE